jgi:uncharacterized protein (TIGR00255 family)
MVASLTGFGRAEHTDALGRIAIEIKSVNNRFLQLDMHLPYGFSWADAPIRKQVSERVSRGKVSLHLDLVDYEPTATVVVNRPLLDRLLDLRAELEGTRGAVPVNLDGILALPGVMKVDARKPDNEETWLRIERVLQQAIEAFVASRQREGANLGEDMSRRAKALQGLADQIDDRLPLFRAAWIERFTARIKELAGMAGTDEARLGTEIALWADRTDVSEELTRLRSHLQELDTCLASTQPVGRRLDFLVQELHREVNTLCNKIGDLVVIQHVLDMKCEIEKIREQAQNIE